MKRGTRVLIAIALLAGLLAWPASAQALPMPEIHIDPDIPDIDPVIVDMILAMQEVDIPDDNLRDALCDLLEIEEGDPITRGDMASDPMEGTVDLSGQGIEDLEGMQYAVNMQGLVLSMNPIKKVPEEMADLSNLIHLKLSKCDLTEVPAHIWEMDTLQYLYLDGNQLTELSGDVTGLADLRVLVLDDNQLAALPGGMGELTDLRVLSVSQNGIGNLPQSMKNCTEMREMYLTGNRLGEIPDWIGSLVDLEVLVADGNEIRSLPGSLSSLENMTTLSVAFNRISRFPDFLSGMDSLDTLYLTANDIKELPADLPDWSLTYIDLEWNDLDLQAHEIGVVLDGMESRGIHSAVIPQKPVPELTPDTGSEGIVKLSWPLISDTYSTMYTYTVAGLKLQRKTGDGDYATIAEMDAGATGYEDGDIEPDNTYTYKITARYKTDTGDFSYTTYRVATCEAALTAAAQPPQTTPGASPTPMETGEETGEETESAQALGKGENRGLLIGLGVLIVLLLGVSIALVIVLARRRKEPLPLPAAEAAAPVPPQSRTSGKTGPDDNDDLFGTD